MLTRRQTRLKKIEEMNNRTTRSTIITEANSFKVIRPKPIGYEFPIKQLIAPIIESRKRIQLESCIVKKVTISFKMNNGEVIDTKRVLSQSINLKELPRNNEQVKLTVNNNVNLSFGNNIQSNQSHNNNGMVIESESHHHENQETILPTNNNLDTGIEQSKITKNGLDQTTNSMIPMNTIICSNYQAKEHNKVILTKMDIVNEKDKLLSIVNNTNVNINGTNTGEEIKSNDKIDQLINKDLSSSLKHNLIINEPIIVEHEEIKKPKTLQEKQQELVKQISKGIILEYIPQNSKSIQVQWNDYNTLSGTTFLNDIIINFYMKFIEQAFNEKNNDRLLVMNSYFYSVFSKGDDGDMTSVLNAFSFKKKFCRNDIFDYDYIIIPIFEKNHWSIIVIFSPSKMANVAKDASNGGNTQYPLIIYLDPLLKKNERCIDLIKKFLCCEYARKSKNHSNDYVVQLQERSNLIRAVSPIIPKQPNLYDCGIFTLCYSEMVIANPSYLINQINKGNTNLIHWFDLSFASTKRIEIQELILNMIEDEKKGTEEYKQNLREKIKITTSNILE